MLQETLAIESVGEYPDGHHQKYHKKSNNESFYSSTFHFSTSLYPQFGDENRVSCFKILDVFMDTISFLIEFVHFRIEQGSLRGYQDGSENTYQYETYHQKQSDSEM